MPPRLPYPSTCSLRTRGPQVAPTIQFHTSYRRNANELDPYVALEIPHDASAATIKKSASHFPFRFSSFHSPRTAHIKTNRPIFPRQFYHLSKLHHPDHNPNDPTSSTRFVRISEAYAILGSPTKRDRYDRDHTRHSSSSSNNNSPRGTHSSASTPFGSRPASGLSKRRTTFHGPPPSFYRSGGWGSQGAKRSESQNNPSSPGAGARTGTQNSGYAFRGGEESSSTSGASSTAGTAGSGQGGGFSPGQAPPGYAAWSEVPHFNREGHLWTQEQQLLRRKKRAEWESGEYDRGVGGGMFVNFLLVTGVVGFACLMPGLYERNMAAKRRVE
ncbi:hypothetical protein MMC19_004981 [Ptychographa xylographoides]|nr:hypothetical protein [Ptychographa xylographoides]